MPFVPLLMATGLVLWGTREGSAKRLLIQHIRAVVLCPGFIYTSSFRSATSMAGLGFSNMAMAGITAFSSARTAFITPAYQ